jgi:hypothetical protein
MNASDDAFMCPKVIARAHVDPDDFSRCHLRDKE